MATTEAAELEEKDRAQKRASRAHVETERQRLADERAAHQAELAKKAKEARGEIDKLMDALDESEQRLVRLHAATLVIDQRLLNGNNNQSVLDDMTLRLARYAVTGKA